jgi:D-alanine-D-alanine ligase
MMAEQESNRRRPDNTHVAVLMGGWSAERPVSLDSGNGCADALEGEGFKVTRVDVGRDIAAVLTDLKPDVALNALHGPYGEDGTIQGMLEILDIPYTHSGVMASAVAMNKVMSRGLFEAADVPVAHGLVVNRLDAAKQHVMPPPYVIKPIAEGSSFGVFIVPEDQAHPPQELFSDDWAFGEEVLIEAFVPGRELTCAVMGDRALDIIEIVPKTRFYDYDAKYLPGGSEHVLPAKISPNIYQNIQTLALKAHRALGCRGVSRADFRYDDRPDGSGTIACLEVNTQPGMTATSLVPELAAHVGIGFGALVTWMVEDASVNR